ncbi:TRAP transporter small permease [Ruicaihuangia caeni]|uniref:TRAP transporter small permease n=1 Tax=Ruicaihuangia caeni TaxID=3042517 RepID=UPI00338DE8B3
MPFFTKYVTNVMGFAAGVVILALTFITVVDVTLRKTGGSLPGAVEWSEVLLVFAVFLAFGSAQVTGDHVSTSVLTSRLGPNSRRLLRGVAAIIGIAAVVVMIVVATQSAMNSIAVGEYRFGIAQVPIWPARVIIVVGLVVFLFEYVRTTVRQFRDPMDEGAMNSELRMAEAALEAEEVNRNES